MLGMIKMYLYAGVAAATIAAFLYVKYEWHDKLVNKNDRLEEQLKTTGEALNKCYISGRKNSVQSFIEGVGDVEDDIIINFGDLHT